MQIQTDKETKAMANDKQYGIVDSVETLEKTLARVREAQTIFSTYTQEQVDKIFAAAALAANNARIPLAQMAVAWPKWPWKKPAWALSKTK